MNTFKRIFYAALLVVLTAACAPQAEATPTMDVAGTLAVELASVMLTQTVAAYSPTPPPPTETPLPVNTETPTPEPITPTPAATSMPVVNGDSPCYIGGPGPNRPITSNITDTKKVEMIGIGSVDGWYVIEDPYFWSPCWISAEDLILEADFDLSAYPVIQP